MSKPIVKSGGLPTRQAPPNSLLCEEPAVFWYSGSSKRFGPIELCMEHAYRVLQFVPPQFFADKVVRMVLLTNPRYTFECHSCHQRFRLLKAEPQVSREGPVFCPFCGNQQSTYVEDPNTDYWELLSESLGLPVKVTRILYEEWRHTADNNLVEYIHTRLKELASAEI